MDAPVSPHPPSYDGISTVSAADIDPEIFSQRVERNNIGAKGLSLAVAIGLNALVLLLLAWWTIMSFTEDEIELIVESGPVESLTQIDKKQFQKKQQTKPTPASGSQAPPLITSAVVDPMAVFVVETKVETDAFGIGDGWGKGAGFGSGGSGGGSVGFFGSRSTAQRVVFCVDASASLSGQQFQMIKRELNKSLKKLASSINYQVIFFSGPAWFAADEHTGKKNNHAVKHEGKSYQWRTKGGASAFYIVGDKDLYTAKWLSANSANLAKTRYRVDAVEKSYGTDWRHPLRMALQMNPKPDVIYFLTDGAVSNGQQAVDQILKINSRGKKAKINTIAMMVPRAANLLGELAKKTGGEFTVVMADGSVKKGKK
jgi:hypothetical protein